MGVPFKYTDGLDLIYFTFLRGLHGDYVDDRIRICANDETKKVMAKVFVHELGHHVDEQEDISGDEAIIAEKRERAKYIDDSYAKKNVVEYVAVGFETFYCGTNEEKRRLRKKNPRLYAAIRRCHRKYRG